MTQIKLRRDTAANFTSANPVLGQGEPAYETDTKKLKIGDGTTAYTQLEYFSAGGGGSTNISATLPLKIVDGVISLEVDGQTIQIVDGKLHANLDGLSNEVNSLSGEVNNLSGRVTAAEADIANKQDELTPAAPITINKYVKSNLHGFSFTTDGTGVYATSGKSLSYSDFSSQAQGYMIFQDNTLISSADESWACYIDVPISLGQVVKFPVPDASTQYYPMCILGKTDATGHFTVITHGYALSQNKCNPTDDALAFDGSYVYTKNKLGYGSTSSSTNIVNNQDPYTGFVQLFEDEAGTFSIQIHKCYGASNNIPNYCTYKYVTSNTSAITRFKEINTVRIVPCSSGTKNGKTAGSAISVNSIGLYNCSTDLFSLNNDMSQFNTGNLFDISGETAHNYLELSIGSGLAITDGKLVNTNPTAYSLPTASADTLGGIKVGDNLSITEDGTLSATGGGSTPTNMVTTDTAQNISGQKEFNKTILFLSNSDLLRAQQSTNYRNGAGLSMGSNSTSTDGGSFAPQWKIYDTAGNVAQTETIITTYNQSKLNSSNFNTANKLVRLDSDGKLPAIDGSQLTNLPSGGSAPTNMVTTDTTQTITGRKTFGDKIIFNRPDDGASEPSSILGGEFKLGTSNYDNSIYANQLLLNANTTNAGTFKVQRSSTLFTQINGATITSQRTDTGAYKIINTIRPSGASSNKNYSVLYSEVDGSYNHKLTINNLSSDLVLAGKTVKDGSGNEFITGSNFITFCQNNAEAIKAALGL